MKFKYVVVGTEQNTLETVYLMRRGFVFISILTDECYHDSPQQAQDSLAMGLVLNDNVINLYIDKIEG
jgi:hypothetical protein